MANSFTKRFKEVLATGFFTGYIPFMPGTFGTLVGVLIYVLLSRFSALYYLLLIFLVIAAVYISDYAEKHIFKIKDAPYIVIDEMVGFLIAMVSFPFSNSIDGWKYLIIGFILFRTFDIWKPYPIKESQKIAGGTGIVIDDVLAGVYTNLFLQFLRFSGNIFQP